MALQEGVRGHLCAPVPAPQAGTDELLQGYAVPRVTCLTPRERKCCPLYLAAELGKEKNTFTPLETRERHFERFVFSDQCADKGRWIF